MNKIENRFKRIVEGCKKNKDYKETIFIWLLLGIFSSLFPLIARIVFLLIIGFRIQWADILSDYLLVVFSVCINAVSMIVTEKKSNKELSVFIMIFIETFFIVVVFSTYSFFLKIDKPNETLFIARIILTVVSTIILSVTAYLGLELIDVSHNKDDKNIESSIENEEQIL